MRTLPSQIRAGLISLTGTGAGASAVLAVLVLATVFVAVVTPRSSVAFRTRALRQVFAAAPAVSRAVVASVEYTTLEGALGFQPGIISIDQVGHEIAGNLTARKVPLQPADARWWGLASGYAAVPGAARRAYSGATPPEVEVLYRSQLGRHSRLLSGAMPATVSTSSTRPVFQVAVTAATASRFKLSRGSVLKIPGQAVLVVSGIIRPVRLRSAFWTADPDAAAATFNVTRSGNYWLGGVFIGQRELASLAGALDPSQMSLQWQYPLRLRGVGAGQATALSGALATATTNGGLLTRTVAVPTSVTLTCGLTGALTEFITAEGRIGGLLGLLEVSLAILGAVVLLLGGRLLAEQRAPEFRLMRARGAGRGQLTAHTLRAGLVVVVPAAAAGALIAILLTPGGNEPAAPWLGALTALAALAGFPVLAARQVPAIGAPDGRSDHPPGRRARARRLVAEITLALAAGGGLGVLRQQGAPRSGGADWFTSAAPVLVAVLVAIVVVRLYPPGVRWLVRLTGRYQGVTTFIGLARAARTSLTAALPAFALVLVLGVVAFGATLRAAVARGDVAASWQSTGADVVIDASRSDAPLGTAVRRVIDAVPGVRRAAAVGTLSGLVAGGSPVSVIVVDPARYAALIAATPQRPFPAAALTSPPGGAAGPLPVLVSPAARGLIGRGRTLLVGNHNVPVQPVGLIRSVPGTDSAGPLVVAAYPAMARAVGAAQAQPSRLLLVGPDIDAARLRTVVRLRLPGANLTFRSERLASLAAAPLPHGTYVAYAQGAAAAAGFGAVVLLMMLALGARSRELTLARLVTMGLSPAQCRRLVITEAAPVLVAAITGGVMCAWALVPLVGPVLDLSPLTGTFAPVPVRPDYAVLGIVAAALLALSLATLFVQSAAARLRGVARALRVGE